MLRVAVTTALAAFSAAAQQPELYNATLDFRDVEDMIAACPRAGVVPMVRLPDAQEWRIRHATDIGALGLIIPTVDDVERARDGQNGRATRPRDGAAPDPCRRRGYGAPIIGRRLLTTG